MATLGERQCGCTGVRSCLLCEDGTGRNSSPVEPTLTFIQCSSCGQLIKKLHQPCTPAHDSCAPSLVWRPVWTEGELKFDGVTVIWDFITSEEETSLVRTIDQQPWAESQSGRKKQDYGPKVNFKRQKVKLGDFSGLPPFSQTLVRRLILQEGLEDFQPVELCNLDYRPERGASIDPHLDDSWLWGERLVTLNLLSDTILTFTTPTNYIAKAQVEVHMPQRSLIVVSGHARYQWQHSIQRHHVTARRVAITFRELSAEFQPGGASYSSMGKQIVEMAALYTGKPTNKIT